MQLTKDFNLAEFQSRDGSKMSTTHRNNIRKLAANLQVLRDHIGKPIHVTSGYRSPSHNKKVGGSPKSQHLLGKAGDIVVESMTPKQIVREIKKLIKFGQIKEGGIGLYNNFVHYDIRGYKARWDNSSWYNFF